jgi:predicted ribosome quality control (RQC) complex YloA/Tae2 family protein
MKAMTLTELQTLVAELMDRLHGAQLQDILSNDRGLALGFRQPQHQYWLVLDLNPAVPFCLLFEDSCPFKKSTTTKPVALFLNSHGKNLSFRRAWLEQNYGRILKVELANSEKSCVIEAHLIPRQANLLVEAEGKHIAWSKPKELHAQEGPGELPEPRSLPEIHEEWLANLRGDVRPSIDPKMQWEKKRQKDLEKKRKALGEIEKLLSEDPAAKLYELGRWLKTQSAHEFSPALVPPEWQGLLNFKESLFKNIETVFEKGKHAAGKIQGTQERRDILLQEIAALEKATFEKSARPGGKPKLDDLMKNIDAKGRKLHLESGAVVYCGKSGADNLSLLRKAKAWDYWLHLKDYPGAHAILHRTRDQEISLEEIHKAALWVLKESLSAKTVLDGQKYAVVLVECRFVRPIKGDKLGRVTYHSEKQYLVST